ncbi:metallophosphoesterase [Thermomicrobium sp. CFH 73360]|uniref:fibronectin type III domain-containing protein n=1 Tax=Thermomicrobium sp. CFH 73360 TaxID=2951987 RepID=UPI0020776ACC|nr:metallophosphoesterase [Thermomicrobium sp. CFH 73360]MCM8745822.1 metallophosphoesterase [Thermomicrobium sp. CFH 73360]
MLNERALRPHWKSSMARYLIALLLTLGLSIGQLGFLPQPAAAASCATSSPLSGTYLVTVCLTQPVHGALLSGTVTVTASVSATGAAPRVQRLIYTLDGAPLLTEFFAPYTFRLPTTQWADGQHTLAVSALMSDGFSSAATSITLFFQNGVTSTPAIPTGFRPTTGTTPPAGQPFRIVAVGDGGDDGTYSAQVAQLIGTLQPNLLLYLGDIYEKGTYTEFLNYYGENSELFAAYRPITNPIVGNHEYEGGIAEGYLRYWQSPPDYYSVNAGGWHLIGLNSTSQFGQFVPGTPQYEWLLRDLQAHRDSCTIAYFHHPRYSIGPQGDTPALQDIWTLLYQFGVELVLVGHDHNYQRWLPLDRNGQIHPSGIVQVVVGTGGHGIRAFVRNDSRVAAGFDRPPSAYGVLRVSLSATGADLAFIDLQGQVRDSTTVSCRGPNDTSAPTTPTGLQGTLFSNQQVRLMWNAAADDYAVTAYEIIRNGTVIATVPGSARSYVDTGLQPDRTYTYQVVAVDAVGNRSAPSLPTPIVTSTALFSDDFESGTLSRWTTVNGLTVTTLAPHGGQYAARALSTNGNVAFAVVQLSSSQSDTTTEVWFSLTARGKNDQLTLVRFLTGSGSPIGLVQITTNGRLAFRNEVAGTTTTTGITVSTNAWHQLRVRLVTGTSGRVELWYDGVLILSAPQNLGSSTFGRLQIGEHLTKRTFDVHFDDVRVAPPSTSPSDTTPPETTLTGTPPKLTNETTATFSFTANEAATFRCSLDGAPAQPCTSPVTYTNLAIGIHTFSVTATDLAGNIDPTPATFTWEVAAPSTPDTTLVSTPPTLTNQSTASFSFISTDAAATFECQLDTVPAMVCSSPWVLTGLSEGAHTFSVRAINGEGEADPTPASWSWRVDLTPPPAPTDVSAVATSGTQVTVTWSSVSDPSGINGYDVYRDGTLFARLGPVTSVNDSTVQPATTYRYTVRARDNAGNISPDSAVATVTTSTQRLFEDDFETGNLIRWSSVNGLTVTNELPYTGSYAARALSTSGTAAYALGTLSHSTNELFSRIRFQVVTQGANNVYLEKWRSGTTSLGGIYITSTGRLAFRNDVTAQSQITTTPVTTGAWHTLEVHLRTGSNGLIEIWYDGVRVLQSFQNFGTNALTQIQLGENSTGRTFDVRFDEVVVDTGPIDAPQDTIAPETTLTSTPPATTSDTSATFAFTANELATFQCSLDGAPTQPCTSPTTYTALTVGPHTFSVAATDVSGNTDPTPATYTWEITATPTAPETMLISTPPALTNAPDATFSFSSDDATATFQCQVDGTAPAACSSPTTLTGLSEGNHTFAVWAVNTAGTADPTPASWSWTIDLTPPAAPTGLTATSGNGRVTLNWTAASDANGLAGYDVFRNGTLLTSLGETTTYTDTTVQPNTTYEYRVVARDRAGNTSPPSDPATITTGSIVLFADDFESGTLGSWTTVSGLTITTSSPYSGNYAAQALSTSGTAAYALVSLPSSANELFVRVRFFVASQGASTVYLVKLRTSTGGSLGGVYISSTGRLGFRNDVAGQSTTTTTAVTPGSWHTLGVHIVVGTSGVVELSYDGTLIATISGNLGTTAIGRFQLGENSTGRTFDIRFDEVIVDTQPIAG